MAYLPAPDLLRRFAVTGTRILRALRRDERGVSMMEAAIAAPILVLMFGATLEFGLNFYTKERLQAAVAAGAQHALRNSGDTTGIVATVNSALPNNGAGATVTTSVICLCQNDSVISCAVGTCASGPIRKLLQVNASAPTVTLLNSVGLIPGRAGYSLPTSLSASTAVAVQ